MERLLKIWVSWKFVLLGSDEFSTFSPGGRIMTHAPRTQQNLFQGMGDSHVDATNLWSLVFPTSMVMSEVHESFVWMAF